MKIATQKLSQYRSRLRKLIDKIDKLAFQCANSDPLIRGTPSEVFRTCGKKTCKCAAHPDNRHGPYPVIQIFKNGKQKQVALKKDQRHLLQKAKRYQSQMKLVFELKAHMKDIESLVKEIIEHRLEDLQK